MKKPNPKIMLLLGGLSLATLTACEQIEQAAVEAAEQARQSAAEVLDEAVRTGSLEQAGQKAREALTDAKQKASTMLGEASEYLVEEAPTGESDAPARETPDTPL